MAQTAVWWAPISFLENIISGQELYVYQILWKYYEAIWTKAKKDFSCRDPCQNAIINKKFSCQNQYGDMPIFFLKNAKND